MLVGRGDYAVDDWLEAYASVIDSLTNTSVEHLIAHPYLANYLEDGLSQFGYSCDEIS